MSERPKKVRRVLLLCSYCDDDDPNCSDDFPCDDCLKMDNVVEIDYDTIELDRVLGGFDYLRETTNKRKGTE